MDANLISKLLRNSLWHAFNALDLNSEGYVSKPRLQVFAASLGNLLNVKNVEKGISDYRSTTYLKFDDFLFYLQKELFTTFLDDLTPCRFKTIKENIEDICWLVCKHRILDNDQDTYSGNFYFKLFRIFCSLSEFSNLKDSNPIVEMSSKEINFITDLLDKMLGKDIISDTSFTTENERFIFKKFLFFIKILYIDNFEKEAVLEAIDEVYDVVVENVIKKGSLKKSLTPVGPWWEMWFVLKQYSFTWFLNKSRKDQSGEINLYNTNIEIKSNTGNQFTLTFGSKSMNLLASDCATKFQWISAINLATKHAKAYEPLQQISAIKQCQPIINQINLKEKLCNDTDSNIFEQESIKNLPNKTSYLSPSDHNAKQVILEKQENSLAQIEAKLEEERQKWKDLELIQNERQADIEKLLKDIAALKEEKEQLNGTLKEKLQLEETLHREQEKLKDYERREKLLLDQLKEERQAKEDEEIVRDLQSRKLAEEWEKIENLERQQELKEAELCAERKRREELEIWQQKRQEEIEHLAAVVTNLEKEKEELHGTLKRTKVLLAQPKKELADDVEIRMKRSLSADFSFMKMALSKEEKC